MRHCHAGILSTGVPVAVDADQAQLAQQGGVPGAWQTTTAPRAQPWPAPRRETRKRRAPRADITPSRLLETLKQVQYHRVRLANGQRLEGVSSMTKEQGELFDHLGVPKPTNKRLKTGL